MVVAFASPIVFVLLGLLLGLVASTILGIPLFVGGSLGFGAGGFVATYAWMNSTIENDATIAFITIDRLASLFPAFATQYHLTRIVVYGPGKHFCFWWEMRVKENTVSLEEAPESLEVYIQTESGGLTLEGSIRLRPDLQRLNVFINGAAAVASDATDIVIADVMGYLTKDGKSLRAILKSAGEINQHLHSKFVTDKASNSEVANFEDRFAVTVGDATISRIIPSDEVKETLNAVTESEVMDQMVANSFGYATHAELLAKIQAGGSGAPTWAQVNQVRTQKMAASGNLQGMDLKDHTFNLNVSGLNELTPEAAAAFGTALAVFGSKKKGGK